MVFIVVAVQKSLPDIKSGLKAKGYNVVDAEECEVPVDAVIFTEQCFLPYICTEHNNINNIEESNNSGVLLINSKGLNLDELQKVLDRRCYTPLFDTSCRRFSNYN